MTLSEIVKNTMILPKDTCASKDELISKLVERIYSENRDFQFPQKDVLNSIYIREKIGGTLLPSGLSVPHARLREYEGFILAIGLPSEPIIHDGIQVRLMALMISSQSGIPWYLPTLAALTKISRDNVYFPRLCSAATPEEFINTLLERDIELL